MILHKISMTGYGKFIQKQITLKNGFNLIYGKNEAGKSTVQAFIKNMLFSFENKNTDSEGRIPDLKKYKPWNGDFYGGSLELSLDDEQYYKIERDFKNKTCRVFNKNLEDISAAFDFNKREGLQFGESLFRIDRNTFVNTALIKQDTTKVLKNDKQEIFDKIINLQETGEENLSVSKAIGALDKARLEIGHKNTKSKLYNKVLEKINELNEKKKISFNERKKVLDDQSRQTELTMEIKQLEEEIRHLEQKVSEQEKNRLSRKTQQEKEMLEKKLSDYNQYDRLIKSLNDKIYDYEIKKNSNKKLESLEENEIIEKLKEVSLLKNELSNLNDRNLDSDEKLFSRKEKISRVLLIVSITGLAAGLIASYLITPYLYSVPVLMAGMLVFSLLYKPKKELIEQIGKLKEKEIELSMRKNEVNDFIYKAGYQGEEDINLMEQTINEIFNEKSRLMKMSNTISIEANRKNDYEKIKNDILKETGFENSSQIVKKIEKLEEELRKSGFNAAAEEEKADFRKILEETKVERNDKLQELAGIKALLNKFWIEDETLSDLEEELTGYQDKMDEMIKSQKALQYAMDLIEASAKDIKLDIIPRINEMMSENLSRITGNVHDNLITGKDTELNTEFENKVRSIYEFSDGTIDQMYLALRIAATDVFSKSEKMPVMLDEVFAFYDKERMSNSFELLYEMSKEKQVILFTCKEDELKIASEFNQINIIEI